MSTSLDHLLGDDPPDRARATTHAMLAFQERRDPTEPYPAARLRQLWEASEPAENHPAARKSDGLYLAYDVAPRGKKAVILTCYPVNWRDQR